MTPKHTLSALALLSLGVSAQAQDQGPAAASPPLLVVEPRVSVTQTFSSNGNLSATAPQSTQTTEVSPGIRLSSESGRLKGFADYSLSGVLHWGGNDANSTRQSLNASGAMEVVDRRVFVDVSGVISQQAISAFQQQSVGGTVSNANLTETTSWRISPYLQGQLGDTANYEARVGLQNTSSESAKASDVSVQDWSLLLSSGSAFRQLGWSVQATRQNVDYSAGRATEADRLLGSVSYALTPQLSFSLLASRESNNYTTLAKQGYNAAGWGASWSPSERTRLAVSRENRFFGDSHSVVFEHRTGLTAWQFSDQRNVSSTPAQAVTATLGTWYDLFLSLYGTRELALKALDTFGLGQNATITQSYLTSSLSVLRTQQASMALQGARSTLTLLVSRSDGRRLDTVLTVNDDFSQSSFVRQSGVSVSYAHRLTPESALSVSLSQQNAAGATAALDSSLRSLLFSLTTRLGVRTVATLGVRHSSFDSTTAPYSENAVTGNLNMRF